MGIIDEDVESVNPKNTKTGAKKAQPSSNQGHPVTHTTAKKLPLLKVLLAGEEPAEVQPGILEQTDWDELVDRCKQSPSVAVLEVVNLAGWPDDARSTLLRTVRDLDGKARLRVSGKLYVDPFEAILGGMQSKPMLAYKQTLRAAIEAAALFHNDAAEMAAKMINQRLAEVGAVKINHPGLVKQIKELVGTAISESHMDGYAVAQAFTNYLGKSIAAAASQVVLRYYQADFYRWREKAWESLEDRNFEAQVMAFLQTREIPKLNERFLKDVLAHLRGMANLPCWKESMPFLVANEDPLKIEHPHWIVFSNGAIDLDKALAGKVAEPFEVDNRYFNQIVLPYAFQPKAKCELWLSTLQDILPKTGKDDNRRLVLQEFMGYSLLLDCRFQKMFVACGAGGNGKTTIRETWQAMLGKENVSAVPLEVLGKDHRQWALKGKLANFSGEFPYVGSVNEGILKQIVSGEEMDTNRKHKDPVKFRPTAKLIVNTNNLPAIQDPSDGSWDRLITMPFDVRIRGTKEEDENRPANLQKELPGIFLWALRGLKRLLKNRKFTPCTKCQALLNEHRTNSDSVREFLSICCRPDKKCRTYSELLYGTYREYAEATGRKPVASPEFGKRLQHADWTKRRGKDLKRSPVYVGMALTLQGQEHFKQWQYKNRRTDKEICYRVP